MTRFLSEKGFYETWDFFDSFTWYPLGRVVGGTMYPGAPPRPTPKGGRGQGAARPVPVTGSATVDRAGRGGLGESGGGGRGGLFLLRRAGCQIAAVAPPSAGLIFTAGAIWNVLQKLNIPIHVQEVGWAASSGVNMPEAALCRGLLLQQACPLLSKDAARAQAASNSAACPACSHSETPSLHTALPL